MPAALPSYVPDGNRRQLDSRRPHGVILFTGYACVATLCDVNRHITRTRHFTVPLSATRRGARLARLLAVEKLNEWGLPLDPARLFVAELAANAVLHGRVPGRSFRLGLAVGEDGVLRIEVADARGDLLPGPAATDGESGYGLLLVGELADRWGVEAGPVPCKTVWAEIDPV